MNKKYTNSLIVISSYPEKGKTHGKSTVGVASYTKNTLLALDAKANDVDITVLAEKIDTNSKKGVNKKTPTSSYLIHNTYRENSMNVRRIWKRNSFTAFPSLLKEILKVKHNKKVLIELEFAMFGNMIYLALFPFFLVMLKLLRKNTTLVLHQVVPDINTMHGQINLKQESWKADVYNMGINLFYRSCLMLSDKCIVFDEVLKERLKRFGNTRKITVIPHGVEEFENIPTKIQARKKLGLSQDSFVVVNFGYLAWYKGTDWIIEAMEQAKKELGSKRLQLFIAGGANPNHADKPFYQKYVKEIEKKCRENGFMISGFVAEKDISLYYQAADLLVFPYRTLMSASGPLSMAFAFNKPFLLSESMKGVLKTPDMQDALESLHIKKESLYFGQNGELSQKLLSIMRSTKLMEKITKLSREMRHSRSWEVIGQRYFQELFL